VGYLTCSVSILKAFSIPRTENMENSNVE